MEQQTAGAGPPAAADAGAIALRAVQIALDRRDNGGDAAAAGQQ